ncbi:hypothetical protein QWY77_06005 [Thalassotalea ponticola]|uniref:hypothetical protein n=1 Tax=Thalassotalea ponticola TaxID=1523392 RepID=UPI0025B40EB2|nr:hypothetical protein [Thalassotalea ponticola]MDN3652313.1 hypothetical protein [Thalassotalea ponticola]
MTRKEQQILKETIKRIIRSNTYLWWELKRQCFEFGSADSVPRIWEYEQPVKKFLHALSAKEKALLYLEALKRSKDKFNDINLFIESTYLLPILEEIGRRANIAANKTVYW